MASYVIQNSVTTWQAYNLWGDYSLYYGRTGAGGSDFANRARDRVLRPPLPPDLGLGRGRLRRQRAPAAHHLESLGPRPHLLDRRRPARAARSSSPTTAASSAWATTSTGPSPCARPPRSANANGVNLAFLGANACYRQIRMEPTSVGPNRLQVCYKDAAEDPLAQRAARAHHGQLEPGAGQRPRVDPHRLHVPVGRREGRHGGDRRLVVVLRRLQPERRRTRSPTSILGEYDRYVPSLPGPRNVDVLAHSPVPGQSNWSDVTYYTAPGNGGGVLASGSASFVSLLSTTGAIPSLVIPGPFPGVTDVIRRAMENVYGRFGLGPASSYGSSGGNWSRDLHRRRRRRRAPPPAPRRPDRRTPASPRRAHADMGGADRWGGARRPRWRAAGSSSPSTGHSPSCC